MEKQVRLLASPKVFVSKDGKQYNYFEYSIICENGYRVKIHQAFKNDYFGKQSMKQMFESKNEEK